MNVPNLAKAFLVFLLLIGLSPSQVLSHLGVVTPESGLIWLPSGVTLPTDSQIVLGVSNVATTPNAIWFVRAWSTNPSVLNGTPYAGILGPQISTNWSHGAYQVLSNKPVEVATGLVNLVFTDIAMNPIARLPEWTQPHMPFMHQGQSISTWRSYVDGWSIQGASYYVWGPTYLSTLSGAPGSPHVLSLEQILETALELQSPNIQTVQNFLRSQDLRDMIAAGHLRLTLQPFVIGPPPPPEVLLGVRISQPLTITVQLVDGGLPQGPEIFRGRLGVLYQSGNRILITLGQAFDLQSVQFGNTLATVPVTRINSYSRFATLDIPSGEHVGSMLAPFDLGPQGPYTDLVGVSMGWTAIPTPPGIVF